jgi:hypothetical protein
MVDISIVNGIINQLIARGHHLVVHTTIPKKGSGSLALPLAGEEPFVSLWPRSSLSHEVGLVDNLPATQVKKPWALVFKAMNNEQPNMVNLCSYVFH